MTARSLGRRAAFLLRMISGRAATSSVAPQQRLGVHAQQYNAAYISKGMNRQPSASWKAPRRTNPLSRPRASACIRRQAVMVSAAMGRVRAVRMIQRVRR